MTNARILVVEDERLVATDISRCLRQLGYEVTATAVSAVEALRQVVRKAPDLILMDIKLKGGIDGVQAAEALHDRIDVPIVYLTSFSDSETVERVKHTFPAGYVLKPFDDRSLKIAVELALHRDGGRRRTNRREEHLSAALAGLRDAVVVSDRRGAVILMNRAAEALTGRSKRDSLGHRIDEVFTLIDCESGALIKDPIGRVALDGATVLTADRTVLQARDGTQRRIEARLSSVMDQRGRMDGVTIIFREVPEPEPAGRR